MRKFIVSTALCALTLVVLLGLPIVAPEHAPQAQADHYWYNWEWSSWYRPYVSTWYPGEYDAFDYGGYRWNLLPATRVCVPGYVCKPGYLRMRYWYDADLGYTYGMCPCGRVFYTKYRYRWW